MNDQVPEWWPIGWTGNAVIECGSAGRLSCRLCIDGDLTAIHRSNYEEILRRWPELWPEIEDIVSCMVDPDNKLQTISSGLPTLLISIPGQPITEGVCWSVAIEFYHDKSTWDVPIDGWTPTSDGAQPYY